MLFGILLDGITYSQWRKEDSLKGLLSPRWRSPSSHCQYPNLKKFKRIQKGQEYSSTRDLMTLHHNKKSDIFLKCFSCFWITRQQNSMAVAVLTVVDVFLTSIDILLWRLVDKSWQPATRRFDEVFISYYKDKGMNIFVFLKLIVVSCRLWCYISHLRLYLCAARVICCTICVCIHK